VVDATAGLAADAFLLASLGCTVMAVERSAVLGALIEDGLRRALSQGSPAVRAIVRRMTLVIGEACDVLAGMRGSGRPDVIYIDPMYRPRKKAALPRKEMRICRRLVGDDIDSGQLLSLARTIAKRRVVVKRHRHAPPLVPGPALRFAGKTVRYDVYLPNA
jgi:16S rRNA (guanine1516-N2)-methyltransferase